MLFTEHQIRKGMRGGCLPFTRSCSVCMFRALEIIISRAALWPDLHLIKSSVLISSVPLSFDVKKDTSVFLPPPRPEVLIEWLSGLVALCIFQAPIRPEWIPQVYRRGRPEEGEERREKARRWRKTAGGNDNRKIGERRQNVAGQRHREKLVEVERYPRSERWVRGGGGENETQEVN